MDFNLRWTSILAAHFNEAIFEGTAQFVGAVFANGAQFVGAAFKNEAQFDGATFSDSTSFVRATFGGAASFDDAIVSTLSFDHATFGGGARFQRLIHTHVGFGHWAGFGLSFDGTQVLHFDDRELNKPVGNSSRVWPEGWTIRPDTDDPTCGRLVSTLPAPRDPTGLC